MGALLSYALLSGLVLMAMYVVYRCLLAQGAGLRFNRAVLLGIYAVSFLAVPAASLISDAVGRQAAQNVTLGGGFASGTAVRSTSAPMWGRIIICIYVVGMAVVAAKTLVTWVRIARVLRAGQRIPREGYTLVLSDDESFAPFSWMRYVVISRADFEQDCTAILTHELRHVECRHWADLLIAQMVCIVEWFNPAAWLMREELMLVHEYQADRAVVESGLDPQDYQMLLIKKAVGSRFPSLANSLNHSKLKKRITMMYKSESSRAGRLRALALVPALAVALGLASVPAMRAAASTIRNSEVSVGKGNEKSPRSQENRPQFKVEKITHDGNGTTVILRGENLGNSATVSGGTLTTDGKTYHANSLNFTLSDGKGTIEARFDSAPAPVNPNVTITLNGQDFRVTTEN